MSHRRSVLYSASLLASLALSSALPAQALLTSAFAGTVATDFDAACEAPGDTAICFGGGPRAVGANGIGATFSANYSFAAWGRLNTGFGANGNWFTRDGVSTSSIDMNNVVSIAFDRTLTHVGAFMNYEPFVQGSPTLRVYNALDQLVAAFALDVLAPISTPGVNDAALFRGIEFLGGIRRIELLGANLAATDFVVREAVAVPEPGPWGLMLTGITVLWWRRRERRAR